MTLIEPTDENIDLLLTIYLDGFTSGVATGLVSFVTQEKSHVMAQMLGNNALRDPAVRETIIDNIRARLGQGIPKDTVMPVNWEA